MKKSLIFVLLAVLLTACGQVKGAVVQASGAPIEGLPGGEEFGMTREELVTNIETVESQIAACMQAAGFEYIAADYRTVRRGMVADKSLPGMTERQFIAQYGFGISTLYTGLAPQLSAETIPAKIGLGELNVAIFNSLAPTDQEAYNFTLFGENIDATFAVALEIEDFSRTSGCTRQAIEQVFTAEQMAAGYYNPLDTMIRQDPRMATAITEFTDCVNVAGFDYAHPDDIEPDLRQRLDEITGGLPVEALSSDALAALEELRAEEMALGIVAFDCESKIIDPVEGRIERELYADPPK
ncbi:MAG: hypothetical protein HN413_02500 [Chloroflexi bacterium]|jgi:hypothetical protein|nr:hypothetical protein [Chloroflexota bacterium]